MDEDRKPGLASSPEELAKLVGTWLGLAVVAYAVLAGLVVASVLLYRWLS